MSAPSFRTQIVSEARKWLGTPYQHQCSRIGQGCDCLGLIRGVWQSLYGYEPEAPPPYTPDWADALGEETLLQAAQRHMPEIPVGSAQTGDVLLFRMGMGYPARHAAILSAPDKLIHAYWGHAVTETHLVPWWRRRIAAAFAFPPIEADPASELPQKDDDNG